MMSTQRKLGGLALVVLALSCNAIAGDARITQLAWLAGCWAATNGEAGSIEQWTQPAGGSMFGVNRVVRNGNTVAFEYMRIVEVADVGLVFTASPSGQATAEFPLLRLTSAEVVFENPLHDFPQRIIYRLAADDSLLGRIEGEIEGQSRSIDFPMARVPCDKPKPQDGDENL